MKQVGSKLFIEKQAMKFSSAHMTVFPDGSKEALHGHNYAVGLTLDIADTKFENTLSFSLFKDCMRPLCEAWDEKVLVATQNPFYQGEVRGGEFEMSLCGKRYVFPTDEVVLLEIDNVVTETLAQELARRFLGNLGARKVKGRPLSEYLMGFELEISETSGQGAIVVYRSES